MCSDVLRFIDAIRFARDLHRSDHLLHPNGHVIVNPKLLTLVRERMRVITGDPQFKIRIKKLPTRTLDVKAVLKRYAEGDATSILLREGLTTCWQRFLICKELCHLYNDGDEQFANDPVEQIIDAKERLVPTDAESVLPSEDYNFYCALETMLPWKSRNWLKTAREEGRDYYSLAKGLLVPQALIEFYFEHGHYGETSEAINGELDRQNGA